LSFNGTGERGTAFYHSSPDGGIADELQIDIDSIRTDKESGWPSAPTAGHKRLVLFARTVELPFPAAPAQVAHQRAMHPVTALALRSPKLPGYPKTLPVRFVISAGLSLG